MPDFTDGVGEVDRVDETDADACGIPAAGVDLRLNEGLNLDVALLNGTVSVGGIESSIEALRLVVGTEVVFHVHLKNSPRTELYGLQILPCWMSISHIPQFHG